MLSIRGDRRQETHFFNVRKLFFRRMRQMFQCPSGVFDTLTHSLLYTSTGLFQFREDLNLQIAGLTITSEQ